MMELEYMTDLKPVARKGLRDRGSLLVQFMRMWWNLVYTLILEINAFKGLQNRALSSAQ